MQVRIDRVRVITFIHPLRASPAAHLPHANPDSAVLGLDFSLVRPRWIDTFFVQV